MGFEESQEGITLHSNQTIIAKDLGSCQPNTPTNTRVEFSLTTLGIRMFFLKELGCFSKYEFSPTFVIFTGSQHFLLLKLKRILWDKKEKSFCLCVCDSVCPAKLVDGFELIL